MTPSWRYEDKAPFVAERKRFRGASQFFNRRQTLAKEHALEHKGKEKREGKATRVNTPKRISSPDQLTDYLRVTNPGVWVLLASIILFLAGIFVWFTIGVLETEVPVKVSVEEKKALVIPAESAMLVEGMPLRVFSDEYFIGGVDTDEYGRTFATANVDLPDGVYDGTVVTEQTHPIGFLLDSE